MNIIEDQPEGLDAMWAEAEASLPKGWTFEIGPASGGTYWARAADNNMGCDCSGCYGEGFYDPERDGRPITIKGPTPAAALHALAARLHEMAR